jgi:hypothetical protein
MSIQTPNQTPERPPSEAVNSDLPQTYTDPAAYNGIPASQSPREQIIPKGYIIAGVIVALVIAVGSIALIMYMAANYAYEMAAVRDIMIIALALESCIFGIALLILLIMVIRLVNMLEFEIKPILERTNETIGMVRGTTTFMGDNVVKPLTTASSYMAGVRKGLKTLFGNPKNNLK